MFNLGSFHLQDMTSCCAALRRLGEGATSLEDVAGRITRFLYTNLTTQPDEAPACVLVRLFKTHPYSQLAPELQTLVDARLGGTPASPDMKCLTLLASTGTIPGWNDPARSSQFRVIPLADREALAKLPMFAQLFAQFQIDLPVLNQATSSLLLDQHATTFNAFHVPDARNSPYVPEQQEFVAPFNVRSVLGFGGLLQTGEMFAAILFTTLSVPAETADLFKTFALSTKLILAPFEHPRLILPAPPHAPHPGGAEDSDPVASLQDRVATLESILAVQEQAVEVQSRRLDASLRASLQHARELQAESLRFETLAATSPLGIFQTDAEGRCLYTNAAWQAISRLSLIESLNDGWSRAIPADDRVRIVEAWNHAARHGQEFSMQHRLQRPDGTIRWVQTRSRPLRDNANTLIGHVGTTEDITERKQAEEAVARSRDMLKSFVEHTPAAVAMLDRDLRYVAVSRRWLQDYRLGEQDITGKHHYDLFPEIHTLREWQDIHQRCLAGAVEWRDEDHFVRADGSDDWLRWEVRPWQDGTGAIGGIIMFTEVITERKNAEKALRESEHRLQEAQAMAHLGNWELDLRTNRLFWSDEIFRIFEIDKAQFSASYEAFLHAVHPDDRALVNEAYTTSVQNRTPYAITHRLQMPDGRIKYVQERCETFYDGEGRPQRSVGTVQDITERQENRLQLQQSQTLLKSVFDHLPNMVFVKDARTLRFVEFNRAGEALTGFSRDELLGKSDYDFFPKAEADFFTAKDRAVLATNALLDIPEEEIKTKHQGVRILRTKKVPLHDDQGVPQYLLGISEDITERKHMEAALLQNEERWSVAFEGNGDGVWDWDATTDTVFFSNRWKSMLGYAPDEVGDSLKEWSSRVHPDDLPATMSDVQRHLRGETPIYVNEHRMRCKDGTYKWILDRGKVCSWNAEGAPLRVVGTHTDMTERKQWEDARFQLQQAIDHGQDGLSLMNGDGRHTYMNPAYAAMYGYTREELLGTHWRNLFHPEWAAMIEQLYLPILLKEGQWQGELVGQRRSGAAFDVDLSLTLLTDPGTASQTLLCACRDISRRKQMERDLIAAKDEAQSGIRAKSAFLATMSHEIRTPMNGVIGMTGLLLDTALTPEQRGYVETLQSSGESLLTIINDILDFSKIEAGKLDLEPIPFDLRTTLDQVLDLLALHAQRKEVDLTGLVHAEVPPLVIGDPGRVKQIMTNLVSNAIKFTQQGEVTVIVSTARREDPRTVTIHVDVTDTGIGIAPASQARLFQSFSQADSSTTRQYGGTGLGLAICKQLVELMRGTIGVESTPGQGSRFWFEVPLERAQDVPQRSAPVSTLGGKRLCMIDDHALNRQVLTQHATQWGMETFGVEQSAGSLDLLRREHRDNHPIDVVVLNMHMPGANGLDLVRQMKGDPSLRDIPIVLLTSIGRRGDGKAAHHAGVSAYLTKPIRGRQLAECLRIVLGRQGAAAEVQPLITRHTLSETAARTRHHLLVVDDNPVNRKVAARMLEKLGHRVDLASNGREALAACAHHRYDLIFMDCQMPDMDGFEATRELRILEAGATGSAAALSGQPGHAPLSSRHIPVVAMTANAMDGNREQCLSAGMDDFISKPVNGATLKTILSRWLGDDSCGDQSTGGPAGTQAAA